MRKNPSQAIRIHGPLKQSKRPSPAQLAGGLVITVGEARKLLGKDAEQFTNDDLVTHIMELTNLAQILLNTSILPAKQL